MDTSPAVAAVLDRLRDDVEHRRARDDQQGDGRRDEDRQRAWIGERHYRSRMKPWRAAETSATASGKSTRIPSRKRDRLLVGRALDVICLSAAPVSSTAVFSVNVANCSRCDSCIASVWRSANSRRPSHQLVRIASEREAESTFHRSPFVVPST